MGRPHELQDQSNPHCLNTGDRIGALRIAARFFDRSVDTRTFKRGMDAYNNPSLYRQLGKDPEQIVRDALDVLAKRFNLY
jgi:hypothetical protein